MTWSAGTDRAHAPPTTEAPRRLGTLGPAAFAAGLTAVLTLWLVFSWGGQRLSTAVDDAGQIVAPAFAVAGCLVGRRRARGTERGRERAGWALLAASAASWGSGSVVWAYYEVLRGQAVPYPSLADVGYLAAVPLAAAALLAFFPPGSATMRRLVDGLLVAGGLIGISWVAVLGPLYATQTGVSLENGLGLAYPIGDVVVLTVAVSLFPRARGRRRSAILLLCAGLLATSVADSLFTYLTTENAYGTTQLVDVMWVVGYLAIGMAGIVQGGEAGAVTQRRISAVGAVLPYALVGLALLAAVFDRASGGDTQSVVFWDVAALIGLVLVRQAMVLRDNLGLTRRLEERVAERTRELAARERHFRALVQRSTDSTTVLDREGRIGYQSPAIERLLGYRPADVDGVPLAALLNNGDVRKLGPLFDDLVSRPRASATVELELRHRDGSVRVCEATLTNLLDDADVHGMVVNMRDITTRRRLQDQLVHDALHDRLTGLATRALFDERLRHSIDEMARHGGTASVLFVNIDRFKTINDTIGHRAGDAVLMAVASRLRECVHSGDTVARLGGDEFGVVLEATPFERATGVAHRMVQALRAPMELSDATVVATVSVGVATTTSPDDRPEDLVRYADVAMYVAKAGGRDRVAVYDAAEHSPLLEEMRLQADLHLAMERGEMRLEYQPVVALDGEQPVGMEALLRWHHPVRGPIPPGVFVPIAERAGLMRGIGRWVLQEACRTARHWFTEMPDTSLDWISVNVSALQLTDDALPVDVAAALDTAGLAPRHLILELTESVLVSAPEHVSSLMETLRQIGVRIAIDDFGTGYSSLSYLGQFTVDFLKVDRSFVDSGDSGGGLSLLARTIVDLCHGLDVQAIAEGIERPDQAESFRAQRCELAQGYLFARPMAAADAEAYLAERLVPAAPAASAG